MFTICEYSFLRIAMELIGGMQNVKRILYLEFYIIGTELEEDIVLYNIHDQLT
jgi:hypothetical protein